MLSIAKGECHLENADAFVNSLKEEKLAEQHGLDVYPQNLLMQALKDGKSLSLWCLGIEYCCYF